MANYPSWLDLNLASDRIIIDFLSENAISVLNFIDCAVTIDDFFSTAANETFKFSEFAARKDSLLYVTLLSECLMRADHGFRLIDLGVGSAIPIIAAVLRTGKKLETVGIDIDPMALEIAAENLIKCNLHQLVKLQLGSIESFLDGFDRSPKKNSLICANPPYLPCPHNLNEEFLPVNGGPDGTKFVKQILQTRYSPENLLALQWGSVTNPVSVFEMIKRRFTIEYAEAWELPFGTYSNYEPINSHLHSQRRNGLASFRGSKAENQSQLVFAAILRSKAANEL